MKSFIHQQKNFANEKTRHTLQKIFALYFPEKGVEFKNIEGMTNTKQ